MKKPIQILLFLFICYPIVAQDVEYETIKNIPYYNESEWKSDNYMRERCLLDLYYPTNIKKFTTVIWFHGGGLTGGEKYIPEQLKNRGIAIVAVNYRLYPKIQCPKYIEDAAAAVAWVFKNIKQYNGDPKLIFISGHSAGGYLTSMVGLDKMWLSKYGIDANKIAGLIPFSGHTITHFAIREERGIPGNQPVVDQYAPLYHVRADAPPMLLITGDRDLEMLGRYEENAYFWRMMKVAGHQNITLYEMDGYGHNMVDPAFPLLLEFVIKISEQ